MISILDNKETFAASNCLLKLIHYPALTTEIISVKCSCSICLLFRVYIELREPKQLLMLLHSLFLFIFLFADFSLNVLTEHCTHRAMFVCATTAENEIAVC